MNDDRHPKDPANPSRRQFVQSLAITSAVVATRGPGAAVIGTSTPGADSGDARDSAPTPEPRSSRALPSPTAHRIEFASGIPLGGIGTGSIEIRPDGYFHDWMIFNLGRWAADDAPAMHNHEPHMDPSALAFYLWTARGGNAPMVRRLGMRADQEELYALSWAKSVEAIEYDATFPSVRLRYVDSELPVDLSATMFSPIVPHDHRTSGTPGFHTVFTVRNTTSEPVRVSLGATLRNPLAWGAGDRRLRNEVTHEGETTFLTMRTDAELPTPATIGSLGMSVTGGDASWIAGEFSQYLGNGFRRPTASTNFWATFLDPFREAGRLPSLPGSTSPASLLHLTDEQIDALAPDVRREVMRALRQYAVFADAYDRFTSVHGDLARDPASLTAYLKHCRVWLDALAGKERAGERWGDGALCSSIELAPGEAREVHFTLGWFFPHHVSVRGGAELGHMYERWFRDAEEVNRFLVRNAPRHRAQTLGFARALADTTMDDELVQAWSSQLSTLVKSSWWTRGDRFAMWEGLGCCGLNTTDVAYEGSFSILAIFPELQKRQMQMGVAFQRSDGRVLHFFQEDLSSVDNGYDRVDMNPQFVLLVCRDYLWTGDRAYLERMWPHVVRAIENTARLDTDGDGIPDSDTRRNTYDQWDLFGTPSYIASLWLGALRAGARLADEIHDEATAARWREWLAKGGEAFERTLWNGEYFSLWVDGARRDECCMSDQLSGELYAQLVGLGHTLPRERLVAALRAVMRHNFTSEQGLVNATYPPGATPRLPAYDNFQAMGNWSGIEYIVAAEMMELGLVEEGRAIVRAVQERYARAGRIWNHTECGDHYYRAMSSWSCLLAATGFKVDAPRQTLTIAPVFGAAETRAPWVASTGWGTLTQTATRLELVCRSGSVGLQHLRMRPITQNVTAQRNGKKLPCTISSDGDYTTVHFAEPIAIGAGDSLVVG